METEDGCLQGLSPSPRMRRTQGETKKCFHVFEQTMQEGILPEKLAFLDIVSACAIHGDLRSGKQKRGHDVLGKHSTEHRVFTRIAKQVHTHILATKYAFDDVVNTALLNMNGKLNMLDSASVTFDMMSIRDVVAWTAIISVYAQQGKGINALQLHFQMMEECVFPDEISFIAILVACASASSERECRRIHVGVLTVNHEKNVVIGTVLVNMYGKLGLLDMALEEFDAMLARNVLTWSALIGIHVQHDQRKKALQTFNDMREQGVLPNGISFINVVGACIDEEDMCRGKHIHVHTLSSGYEMNISLGNSLVNMYSKCGSFKDAYSLFKELSDKDIVSFTTMIAACVSHKKVEKAFEIITQILMSGNTPDPIAFASILETCSNLSTCSEGRVTHAFVIECGYDSGMVISNILVNLYGKYQNVEEAQNLFERMPLRDRISWNSIIGMYAQQGWVWEVLQVFRRMHQEETPDKITYISIMSAFTGDMALSYGEQIHVQILCAQSEIIDASVGTALISMYGRCGSIEYAERVFSEVRARDLVVWTAFSTIYAHYKMGHVAIQLFNRMLLECFIPDQGCWVSFLSAFSGQVSISKGKQMHAHLLYTTLATDIIVNNALLNMYGKCGGAEDAEKMFDNMSECDSVSWNVLVSIYNLHGRTTQLVNKMLSRGYMPDIITWTSWLTACAEEADLTEGKKVHTSLNNSGHTIDTVVTIALISLYGRCGDLETARKMFHSLESRTPVSWNAMIAVYAQHGLGQEALSAFKQMLIENVKPDEITFTSVLAACSHDGLLLEGCLIFSFIIGNNATSPSADHFSCIIDLLGRIGRLDEAENLINALPIEDVTALYFLALLGSCRYQSDVERGERAAQQAFELDSEIPASYVLLSNLYVHANYDTTMPNMGIECTH